MIDKLIWAKAGIINEDDAKIHKEIERIEKECASFDISTKAINEKWGIWMQFRDDELLVDVEPNEFVNKPIIRGYCDRKQCVQALYQGLLSLAMDYPLTQDSEYSSDPPALLVAYNSIKSPMIENYLSEKREDIRTRQVHVKHILTINPDVDQIFINEEGESLDASNEGELYDVYDKKGQPIVMQELKEWADEIFPAVCASATCDPYEKDWADYHRRGLELAHRLRENLSPDFDLWYQAPFEDKSDTIPEPILIINSALEKKKRQ